MWLVPWCEWLNGALHREVLRLRVRYELSVDEFRGLYVSHTQVAGRPANPAAERPVAVGLR
jgi:hypothetical protein